jgi:hypothetical protein
MNADIGAGLALLADAEGFEEVVQHALVVDFAGYLAKGVEGAAKVAGEEFGRAVDGYFGTCRFEALGGAAEGVGVAGVDGDDLVALVLSEGVGEAGNVVGERVDSVAGKGGKRKGGKAKGLKG